MDLSSPLATVTPTLDGGVLQVLAATTSACTAAEVHRRLGRGSDEGVRKVLSRLVHQGVVLVERPIRYPLYRLNLEHVAVPHIAALTRIRGEVLDRIRGEVAGWDVAPVHAGLFGSFARGTADSDSDIDILLVSPATLGDLEAATWLEQVSRLDRLLNAWTGNTPQVVDLSADNLEILARTKDPLVDSWLDDGIHLHGERLPDLVGHGR